MYRTRITNLVFALTLTLALLSVSTLMLPTPVSAQDTTTASASTLATLLNIPLCPDVFAVAPENPAFISANDSTRFAWSGEPDGAARRDFVAYDNFPQPDGSFLSSGNLIIEAANPLEHTTSIGAGNALPGTYNWMAVFYDGSNNAICRTNTYWLDVRGGSGSSPDASTGGGVAVVPTTCGYFVVVLNGSPYTGSANLNIAGDDYDGSGQALGANCGLIIHGNNNANSLTGGVGADQIFGYAGNDILNGGDGNDTLNGGNETINCPTYASCINVQAGDTLNGEAGDDLINGGDESCTGTDCQLALVGDIINGDSGSDTINGGNEICNADFCDDLSTTTGARVGDTINGGTENDTISGGDETCNGSESAARGCIAGDTIYGDGGDDTISGGNESCPIEDCSGVTLGDTINGGAGNDDINGGNESCSGDFCDNLFGPTTIGDTINGDDGDDNIDGGTETCIGNCAGTNPGDVIDGGANDTNPPGDTCTVDPNDNSVVNCES